MEAEILDKAIAVILHDGAWAALCVFLIVVQVKRGEKQTNALVQTATAITALKTYLETVFSKKPEEPKA